MSEITIPATGTGTNQPQVATDQVAGIHYQYVKLVDGTVGSSNVGQIDGSNNLHVLPQGGSQTSFIPSGQALAASAINYGGSVSAYIPPGQLLGASVSNLPALQPVSGYLGASIAGGASITVYQAAAPSGGASPFHFISGASVNNVNLKNGPGTVYLTAAMNLNSSPRFLRLYDKASTPSVGADVPIQTYVLPGNSQGAGAVIPIDVGICTASGIGFGITGGSVGDGDTTVTGLGDVVVNLGFK